jgi:protein involved in polysaccharide export with SLBB domain
VKYFFVLILLQSFFLSGCSSSKSTLSEYPLYTDQVAQDMKQELGQETSEENALPDYSRIPDYVAPGFVYSMLHPSDNKLTGKFRSDFSGMLKLPYDVEINTSNKTFSELKELVLKSYQKFFQKGVADVTFELSKKEIWVEVRGLVKKPGRYLIRPSDSLDLVVDAAGGVQGDISVDYFSASIKQGKIDYKVFLNNYFNSTTSGEKIRWLGGDNIFISKVEGSAGGMKEFPFVTIIGGVTKPGKILYQKGASLYYFIEKAGGTIEGLGYKECYVFRNTKEGVKKIHFAFNDPETIPVIFPHDTIYMNTQVKTSGDVWLERLAYVSGILSTVALFIIAL